uniref:DZF domain-containing protein n=1 Tax=Hydatigena taeniaeformis TaxID=6205 RepID=A0A0R3X3E2_HYDTA
LYSQVNFDIHVKGKKHIDKKKQLTGSQEQVHKFIGHATLRPMLFVCHRSPQVKALTQISQCDTDVVLQIPFEGDASISPVALTVALGLVQENRAAIEKFSEHCFGVWICSKKSAVPRRMEEVRLLSKNITKNRPRLVNIVKDAFSMDDRSCGITQHEIAFSTPGGLHNLLESVPNVQRAICVLVFTDVELSVDNDPTERLLNHFVCFGPMHPTTRPRVRAGWARSRVYIFNLSSICFVLTICRLSLSHLGGFLVGHHLRHFLRSVNSILSPSVYTPLL